MCSRPLSVWLLLLCAWGCDEGGGGRVIPSPSDGGAEAPEFCPDPAHPRVHYVNRDPMACRSIVLECRGDDGGSEAGQNGFDNACGCGCIDKGDPLCPVTVSPDITWWSRNPAECPEAGVPSCPLNEIGFSTSCGCGCKRPGV
jgi:hypothetical protein